MKMAKQSSEEFQEVSEVSCESPNAKIHTVVESLLPMKCISKGIVVVNISWTKTKRLSYLSPLHSPCIHRFFLNLSDSFSFALLSSDAVSLCFSFRSLARSRLDCSRSISALTRSFSHVDRLLVGPVPRG